MYENFLKNYYKLILMKNFPKNEFYQIYPEKKHCDKNLIKNNILTKKKYQKFPEKNNFYKKFPKKINFINIIKIDF